MKNTLTRARATAKSATKKNAAVASRATQKVESVVKSQDTKSQSAKTVSAGKSKPAPRSSMKVSKAGSTPAVAGSTPAVPSVSKNPVKKVAAKSPAPIPKKSASQSLPVKDSISKTPAAKKRAMSDKPASVAAVRATKKRAPKDLAAQYGEKEKTPRKNLVAKAPRKRRDAAARARLQEVIAPDDALLLRLARAGAISSSLAPASAGEKPVRVGKTRRARQWEAHCGKCGKSAFYRASAALCESCGAILVRE